MMWALINKSNVVVDCLVGISYEEAQERAINGNYLVEMTLDNSPAVISGTYDGKNFIPPLDYTSTNTFFDKK